MPRVFLTGSGPNRGYHTGSGIMSLAPKLQLRDRDNQTGSYPTIARVGDPDFTGRYNTRFNDTNTILFISGVIMHPTNLPTGSKFISGNIVSPSFLQGLIMSGTSSAGTADAHVTFITTAEKISPFNDSRLYLDNNSEFYATGTTSGTLPGFTQRLSSKASLVFDVAPKTPGDFFFSTGTAKDAAGIAGGVNSSLGYFNWITKKWEMIGDLSSGSNIDILNADPEIRRNGLMPFVPSNLDNSGDGEKFGSGSIEGIAQAHGLPFTNFGFPFASKYDATGSQMLSLTSSITAPFLVEKIVVEFSASFGPHVVSINRFGPAIKQFFLMTQGQQSGSLISFTDTILSATNPGEELNVTYDHGFYKNLIAYGQVSLLGGPGTVSDFKRDLNIYTPPFIGASKNQQWRQPVTGSYRVEFLPKIPSKNNFAGAVAYAAAGDREPANPTRESARIKIGGRDGFSISNGRSFVGAVGGFNPIGIHTGLNLFKEVGTGNQYSAKIADPSSLEKTSPFIIMPDDNLIFGFCNTPNWYGITQYPNDAGNRYEKGLSDANVVLSPGAGKLTIYGSLLQNNLPIEPETNQPLTSDALHEDLHYNIPVHDQFDVEPLSSMTGSYTDLIITGSMLATPLGDPFAKNVRSVQGSAAAGQAGITGSLQRFVSLTDSGGTMYDSYPPDAADVLKQTSVIQGRLLGWFIGVSGGDPQQTYMAPGIPTQGSPAPDQSWYLYPAYELSSVRFLTGKISAKNRPVFDDDGTNLSNLLLANQKTVMLYEAAVWPGVALNSTLVSDKDGGVNTIESHKNAIKSIWGFGDALYNSPQWVHIATRRVTPVIRGYKYGLAGLFGSYPDARFRRDRYGQFRDMLEQRRFPATLKRDGSVDYPISITFVSRDGGTRTSPEKTYSQNLSQYATSSLPYYDGLFVERSDNPDIVLIPVEIKASKT